MSKMSKIDQIHLRAVCNAMYVQDVEDRSNTPKGCNAMLFMSKMSKMHSIALNKVEDLDQIKGCNANVEDVKDAYKCV